MRWTATALAADLGFAAASPNSLDAVSDRDFIAEFLFWAALLGVASQPMAEDLILWSSREFGFVQLADAYSTGSSLMPQKKNPDVAGAAARQGRAADRRPDGLLATLKGLPGSYNKDLQEDKEPLFDAVDTLALALPVAARRAGDVDASAPTAWRRRWATSCWPPIWPIELVRRGVPFRQSHQLVGQGRAPGGGAGLRAPRCPWPSYRRSARSSPPRLRGFGASSDRWSSGR